MPERIALMIESDGPGGAESVVLTLAREYRDLGHEVLPVVHMNGPGWLSGRLQDDGFKVLRPALSRPLDPGSLVMLKRWMQERAVTAVHTHEFTTSVYGVTAARLLGLRSIMTMHGGKSYTKAVRRRIALGLAARWADAVVGVSSDTADVLRTSLRLQNRRIHVVPNGVSPRSGDRARGRASVGCGSSERLILAVGNLYPVKGHDILLEACAHLLSHSGLPAWRLVIAGRGDQRELLESLIERLDLADRVQLLGLRDDIPDLLAAADLFVMPSRSEGLPMAILEAMFAKVPVVASSVGGIPELLGGGRLGFLCPPEQPEALGASLATALADDATSRAHASLAFDFAVARYSARAMTDAYLSLLAS